MSGFRLERDSESKRYHAFHAETGERLTPKNG